MSLRRLRPTRQRQKRLSGGDGKTTSATNGEEVDFPKPGPKKSKRLKADAVPKAEERGVNHGAIQETADGPTRVALGTIHKYHSQPPAAPQFISFDSTAELLIHLSTRIIDLMNDRNYTSPFLSCLAPDIESPWDSGRSNVIEGFRLMAEALPNYHNKVQNATCTVDEQAGRAKVVMTMRVSGFVFGTMRQSSSLCTWERKGDRWSCAKYCVLRGIEEFD